MTGRRPPPLERIEAALARLGRAEAVRRLRPGVSAEARLHAAGVSADEAVRSL